MSKRSKPGLGWSKVSELAPVWVHAPSGMRIHILGLARLRDGSTRWFDHDFNGSRRALHMQGFNRKRGVMVWALGLMKETA